jgi:Pyruvate/2-oxoacid:ferredoxin oxidoreductase delta subunit
MRILICYFSATGNTARAAETLRAELAARGQSADLERIRSGFPPEKSPLEYDYLIIAFPTLAMAPPQLVKRFIKGLPRAQRADGSRCAAASLAVDAGGCGPAPLVASRLLASRGYDVVLSGQASYPENWIQVGGIPRSQAEADEKLAKGDRMCAAFAQKVVSGKREAFDPGLSMKILGGIIAPLYGSIGRRFIGKAYIADASCNSCGICARTCPAAVIAMGKGKGSRPYWNMNCECCNRCMNICPQAAINMSIPRLAFLLAAVIAFSAVGIGLSMSALRPLLRAALPAWLAAIGMGAIYAAVVAIAHVLAVWPLDFFVLRFIQRIPFVGRFFSLTYTKGLRRYTAPGYVPENKG